MCVCGRFQLRLSIGTQCDRRLILSLKIDPVTIGIRAQFEHNLSYEIDYFLQMVGGLDFVRERVMQLEATVGASPDETRSLTDRLDVVADGFLSIFKGMLLRIVR